MATFFNLDFESPLPGGLVTAAGTEFEPAEWFVTEIANAIQIANYSDAEVRQVTETFSREWGSNEDFVFEFIGAPFDLEIAIFNAGPNPSTVEDFERLWSGSTEFTFILAPTEVAVFTTSGDPANIEDFESEWGNSAWIEEFATGDLQAFSVGQETFDWVALQTDLITTEMAVFQSPLSMLPGTVNFEAFEDQDGGIYDWFMELDVNGTGGVSSALFLVTINGSTVSYQASSTPLFTIRDNLRALINGMPEPVEAQDSPTYTARLDIRQTDQLPVDLVIGVEVRNPSTGDSLDRESFATRGFWSQSGLLATEV